MGLEILDVMFRGICVGVAASITVGPVAVLCIQRTLSKSRRSGIVSGLGVACADTFMAMAALFFTRCSRPRSSSTTPCCA